MKIWQSVHGMLQRVLHLRHSNILWLLSFDIIGFHMSRKKLEAGERIAFVIETWTCVVDKLIDSASNLYIRLRVLTSFVVSLFICLLQFERLSLKCQLKMPLIVWHALVNFLLLRLRKDCINKKLQLCIAKA